MQHFENVKKCIYGPSGRGDTNLLDFVHPAIPTCRVRCSDVTNASMKCLEPSSFFFFFLNWCIFATVDVPFILIQVVQGCHLNRTSTDHQFNSVKKSQSTNWCSWRRVNTITFFAIWTKLKLKKRVLDLHVPDSQQWRPYSPGKPAGIY